MKALTDMFCPRCKVFYLDQAHRDGVLCPVCHQASALSPFADEDPPTNPDPIDVQEGWK